MKKLFLIFAVCLFLLSCNSIFLSFKEVSIANESSNDLVFRYHPHNKKVGEYEIFYSLVTVKSGNEIPIFDMQGQTNSTPKLGATESIGFEIGEFFYSFSVSYLSESSPQKIEIEYLFNDERMNQLESEEFSTLGGERWYLGTKFIEKEKLVDYSKENLFGLKKIIGVDTLNGIRYVLVDDEVYEVDFTAEKVKLVRSY